MLVAWACAVTVLVGDGAAFVPSGHDWSYRAMPMGENLIVCGAGMPAGAGQRTRDGAATWNYQHFSFTFAPDSCASGGSFPSFNNVNQIDFGAGGLDPGVLAVTVSWFLTSNPADTVECDMRFSSRVSWYSGTGAPDSTQFDWQTVAVHEMGHCLGLGHQDGLIPPPVMTSTIGPGQTRRALTADDIAGRNAIYGSTGGSSTNFELVVPAAPGGLVHYFRPNNPVGPWAGPTAAFGGGAYEAVTLIQSDQGDNLEVVARQGQQLVAFYRDSATLTWRGPTDVFAAGVAGTPAMIQSRNAPGNFELVVPLAAGGLAHYFRPNGPVGPWAGPTAIFGGGVYEAVTLIQSHLGENFEVVARQGQQLVAFYRNDATQAWHGPTDIFAAGVAGNPAMIQSRNAPGNFELVVPLAAGGLAHYFRPNDPVGPWAGPTAIFGSGVYEAVTFIQSHLGDNLEVVARQGQRLVAFYRDDATQTWHGPTEIFATGVAGNPAMIQPAPR